MGPVALAGCAAPAAASSELSELKAEVRALRQDNQRLEQRLDRVELHTSVGVRPPASTSAPINLPDPRPEALPNLTVVKLKPRVQAAPKLPTQVAIIEPGPEVVQELKSPPPAAEGEGEVDGDGGDAAFDHGVMSLKTGNVEGGVAELQKFAAESPKHPRADNALYYSGLGLMGLNDYEDAARAFEQVVTRYPAGDAMIDSMLKLGECRVRLNQPSDARSVYQKIVANYPGTTAATQAEARLSSLTASP